MQSVIRSRTPPFQPPLYMLIAEENGALAAAAIYEEVDGPGFVELQFMAVGQTYRRQGGWLADATFVELFHRLEERAIASRIRTVQVTGRIHPLNVPSQRMALRARMRHVTTFDNGVQEWATTFDVAVVGDEPRLW